MKASKIALFFSGITGAVIPLSSIVSCSSKSKTGYDLYVFTGKNENLTELKKAATKFAQLYKQATGKAIKVKVDGAGNGADVNTVIKSFLQKKSGAPDIVTSFGIGDVKQYVNDGIFEEIKADDPDLEWARKNNSIASQNVSQLLKEELMLKDDSSNKAYQWGLPINYEAVGIVVNLKTLGGFIKKNKADPRLKIGKQAVSNIDSIDVTKSDQEIGHDVLKHIYQNGWSKNELDYIVTKFNAGNANNGAFALAASPKDTTWIAGFHAVPNWLSTRKGSEQLNSNWVGYRNSFETIYPKDITASGGVFKNSATKTPLDYIAEKTSISKANAENIIADYYKTIYGNKVWDHESIGTYDSTKVFTPFGNGQALFTHASTGMYPWIIKTIGANKIAMKDIAPIPMPLKTNNGSDLYKDVPVDFGMLWHILNKNDAQKSKLAKKFLEWISTGKTSVTNAKDEIVEINDESGIKLFYNSENSKLVNPFKSSKISGGDITSNIIRKEIKGQDYGDDETQTTDYVTLWTNGGLGEFSKMGGFAEKILKNAGKTSYTGKVDAATWDSWKGRLNENEL